MGLEESWKGSSSWKLHCCQCWVSGVLTWLLSSELRNVLQNTTKAGKKKHYFMAQFSIFWTGFGSKWDSKAARLNLPSLLQYFQRITVGKKPLKSTCFDASAIVVSPEFSFPDWFLTSFSCKMASVWPLGKITSLEKSRTFLSVPKSIKRGHVGF